MSELSAFLAKDRPRGPVTYVLRTGKLSLAALAELAKRVKEGERMETVEAELLIRERKGVQG